MENFFDPEGLRKQYESLIPRYNKLARTVRDAIQELLEQKQIDFLTVSYRVKNFDSFYEKIFRKKYKLPFVDIEDICGIRVICPTLSDCTTVLDIIKSEFNVIVPFIDKTKELQCDQFGYRSIQGIVTIKKEWAIAPNYRDLDDIKIEIQIRTILMHAWAEVEHEMAYKKAENIPNQFKRRFNQLAAVLELTDEQIDALTKERIDYRYSVAEEISKEPLKTMPLNVDSLQAVLDLYFAKRNKNIAVTAAFIDIMREKDLTLEQLITACEKLASRIDRIENVMAENDLLANSDQQPYFAQVGAARIIAEIFYPEKFQENQKILNSVYQKIREEMILTSPAL
jgi:ppGpp synthetase/RelA/SpoT-type nucleotidyltranferase